MRAETMKRPARKVLMRGPEMSKRAAAVERSEAMLGGLQKAVAYLLQNGVYVIGFAGRRNAAGVDVVTVQVAPSGYLRVLFGDALWLKQRRDGALVTHTWFVERFGVRIEWEDVCVH